MFLGVPTFLLLVRNKSVSWSYSAAPRTQSDTSDAELAATASFFELNQPSAASQVGVVCIAVHVMFCQTR